MSKTEPDEPKDGIQLQFSDGKSIETSKPELWRHVSDPELLATCIPGAETVERITDRKYSVEIVRGISRLSLSLSGDIELVELQEPDWILAEGTAYDSKTHSDFTGTAAMEITRIDESTVELRYEAFLTFSGGSASLSPKILRAVVESDVDQYFENVQARVEDRSEDGIR